MKDVQAQVPTMQCLVQPSNTQGNLLVNRERPPFDNADIRRAMGLAMDRKAFSDILSRGVYNVGGAMLAPPEGLWGWSGRNSWRRFRVMAPTWRKAGRRDGG